MPALAIIRVEPWIASMSPPRRLPHEIEAHAGFPRPARPDTVRVIERVLGGRFGVTIGRRYDAILEAAGEVLARRGFHQASIREIARAAHLSLAGLYHYVGGKDELLFLVLDRALDRLLAMADAALEVEATPEARLLALIRTHLEFGFHHADALRIVNRDWELVAGGHRAEVAARRRAYMQRWLAVLAELDPHGRSERELFPAANLLLGMLNGIAVRPFLKTPEDPRSLARQVGALFLDGFLESSRDGAQPLAVTGDVHDA
jgi:AcrR family transcriptional regulator